MKPLLSLVLLISACAGILAQDVSNLSQSPPLRIVSQPDAPLRIISAHSKLVPPDNKSIEVYVVVENVSQQPVRNYTTLRGPESNPDIKGCLGPPASIGLGLKPGEQTGTSSWQPASTLDEAPAVWIDFVELADGTRWGADDCHTGDFFDGKRAGTRSQAGQLLGILREQGIESLMRFINDNFQSETSRKILEAGGTPALPLLPQLGHSKRWQEGFRAGAKMVLQEVIKAEHEHGPDEVEHVLSRSRSPM